MADEARVGISITADTSQAKPAIDSVAASTKELGVASEQSAAASTAELEAVDAKTKILGTAAGQYDAATLAALGFKLAQEEEGVAAAESAAAEEVNTAARAEGAGVTINAAVAERALSGSRQALIRAAIDSALAETGLKDAFLAAAPALIAAATAGYAVNAILGAMKDRGLEVSTIGDVISRVMDRIAISFGGVSKEGAKIVEQLTAIDQKARAAGASGEVFASGQERLAAAGVDVSKAIAVEVEKLQQASDRFGGMYAEGELARQAAADFTAELDKVNKQLNLVAAFSPADARKLTQALVDWALSADHSAERLAAIEGAIKRVIGANKDLADELSKASPAVRNAYLSWGDEVDTLKAKQEALRKEGATDAEVQALTATSTDNLTKSARELDGTLTHMNPQVAAQVEAWRKAHPELLTVDKDLQTIRKSEYDLIEALNLEGKKHVENLAIIQLTAAEKNRTLQTSTKDTVDGIDTEIDSITSRDHSDTESKNLLDQLYTQRKKIRSEALAQEIENNNEASASAADEAVRHKKASDDILGSIDSLIKGYGPLEEKIKAAKEGHDHYAESAAHVSKALDDQLEKAAQNAAAQIAAAARIRGEATPAITGHADAHERINAAMRDTPSAAEIFVGALGNAKTAVAGLRTELAGLQADVDRLAGSGGGIPGLQGGQPLVGGEAGIPGLQGGEALTGGQ